MPESTPSGRQLGDFRILRELGRGGMGVVYAAEHVKSGRRVALKVLEAHFTLQRSAIDRFLREGRAALSLRHPHIVRVEQVREHAGVHWFAMELIDGASLADVIRELQLRAPAGDPPTPPRAPSAAGAIVARTLADWLEADRFRRSAQLLAGIARALEHAHRRAILHRDVKPSNILLRPDGHPLLIDFGLAREQGLPGLTLTGDLVGSPYYVAPEQIRAGHPPFDPRLDIYGLGVVLYELTTLRRPFEGKTQHEVLDRIADGAAAPPRSVCADVPVALEAICLRAMAHAARDRYATAAEFAHDLEQFAAGRAGQLHVSPWQRLRFRGGERTLQRTALGAAAVLATLGLAGSAWWGLTRTGRTGPATTPPGLEPARAATHAPAAMAQLDVHCSATDATLTVWPAAPIDQPPLRARLPLLEPLRVTPGVAVLRVSAPGHLPREYRDQLAPELAAGSTWRRHVWLPPWETTLAVATPAPVAAQLWLEASRAMLLGLESGALLRATRADGAAPLATLDGELRELVSLHGVPVAFAAAVRAGGRVQVLLLAGDGSVAESLPATGSVTLLRALDLDADGRDELLIGEDIGRLTLRRFDPSAAPAMAPPREVAVRGAPLAALRLGSPARLLLLTSTELAALDLEAADPAPTPWRTGIARNTELHRGPDGVPLLIERDRGRLVAFGEDGAPRFEHDFGGPICALLLLPAHADSSEQLLLACADGRRERLAASGQRAAEPDGAPAGAGSLHLALLRRAHELPWVVEATTHALSARTLDGAELFALPLRESPLALATADVEPDGDEEIVLTCARRVELLSCPSRLLLRAGDRVERLATAGGALLALQADGRALRADRSDGARTLDGAGAITAAAFAGDETWVARAGRIERLDATLRPMAGTDLALGSAEVLRLASLRGPAGAQWVVADSSGGIHLLTGAGHREQRSTPRTGATLRALAIGDVDGDGADEIAAAWTPTGVIVFDAALRPCRPYAAAGDVVDVAALPADRSGRGAFAIAAADGRLHRLDARGEVAGVVEAAAPFTALAAAPPGGGDLALLGCATGELFALQEDWTLRAVGALDQPVVALAVATAGTVAALTASALHVGTLGGGMRRLAAANGAPGRLALLEFDTDGVVDVAWVASDGRLHLRTVPQE